MTRDNENRSHRRGRHGLVSGTLLTLALLAAPVAAGAEDGSAVAPQADDVATTSTPERSPDRANNALSSSPPPTTPVPTTPVPTTSVPTMPVPATTATTGPVATPDPPEGRADPPPTHPVAPVSSPSRPAPVDGHPESRRVPEERDTPALSASPTTLDFGDVATGTVTTESVTFTNTGDVALGDLGLTVSGFAPELDVVADGLDIVSSGCAASLPPGGTCTIDIAFTPIVNGTASRVITLRSGPLRDPIAFASVEVTGTGVGGLEPAPELTATPLPVAFGEAPVGVRSTPRVLTITNTGNVELEFGSFSGAPGVIREADACTEFLRPPLGPGESCEVELAVVVDDLGAFSGTLTYQAGPVVLEVPVTATGVAAVAELTASPTTLAFGPVGVGDRDVRLMTITNTGNVAVEVGSVGVSSGSDAAFTPGLNIACVGALAPGEDCDEGFVFAPDGLGAASGAAEFVTDEAGTLTVPLTGTGVEPPSLAVDPTTVDFGEVAAGETSPPEVVTVTNTGAAPVVVSVAVGCCGFRSVTPPSGTECRFTRLATGDSCAIGLVFQPDDGGSYDSALFVENDSETLGSIEVPLNGEGIGPELTLDVNRVRFSGVVIGEQSAPEPVTVTNTGDGPVTVTSVSASPGLGDGPFVLSDDRCTDVELAPAESCVVDVAFAPVAAAEARETLAVQGTDGNVTPETSATLTGVGLLPRTPEAIDFGGVVVGQVSLPRTVIITNPTDTTLDIFTLGTFDDEVFPVERTSCGEELAAGASCEVEVRFKPQEPGDTGDRFDVFAGPSRTNAASLVAVPLTGTGVEPAPEVTPSTIEVDFGEVTVGEISPAQEVTFTNTGNVDVTFAEVTDPGFVLDPADCTEVTLEPGASCTVTVRFAPIAAGPLTDTLVAATSAGEVTVTLSGTGIPSDDPDDPDGPDPDGPDDPDDPDEIDEIDEIDSQPDPDTATGDGDDQGPGPGGSGARPPAEDPGVGALARTGADNLVSLLRWGFALLVLGAALVAARHVGRRVARSD